MKDTKQEDMQELLDQAEEYNKTLIGGVVPDAFAVREDVRDESYEAMLDVSGNGMMGYIDIPSIKVDLPIYHYTTEEVLQKGVGHLFGSSLPVGGESTHAVLSAHRGLPSAKLFTDLNLVEEGDKFMIHVMDETLAYEVDDIRVVEPDETDSLAVEEGKDLLTLVTCTPYGVNTQRLLVRGHRIPYTEEVEKEEQGEVNVHDNQGMLKMQILCIIAGLAIAGTVFGITKHSQKRKGRKPDEKEDTKK